MKRTNKEIDHILDRVTGDIHNEQLDPAIVDNAANRVWAKISDQGATALAETIPVEQIRNCADFQSLIPAYQLNKLSNARLLLFEDHTRECLPCRKALKAARTGQPLAPQTISRPVAKKIAPVYRYAAAAFIFIVLSLLAIPVLMKWTHFGETTRASVQSVAGPVYRIAAVDNQALKIGAELKQDDIIRTGKAGGAMVRLSDGSMVEMNERSEFTVSEDSRGITINLKRGNIIVQAAKQHSRHLYVATNDCLVSVTGTIFSVNNGTKGSRVSVVEGEVHVDHNGEDRVLHPGDQTTTNESIDAIPVQDEIAWSRDAERYIKILGALTSLGKELNEKVTRPGIRYSTRLLDVMPEGTAFYAALPNLSTTLSESYKIMKQRIAQNPALSEWFDKKDSSTRKQLEMDLLIEKVREFGQHIGNEIVITAQMDGKGKPNAPMMVAELTNPSAFRPFLEQQLQQLSLISGRSKDITIIDDPLAIKSESLAKSEFYIWLKGDLMAASPKIEPLQQLAITLQAGTNRFTESAFHTRIAEVYHNGAGMIIAADLEKVIASVMADTNQNKKSEIFQQMGLTNLKHLIVEQRDVDGQMHNRAVISFNENRKGIASWLAAPGPMGALDFVSPEANMAAAFVVKEPVSLIDDLFSYMDTINPKLREHLNEKETEHGISLKNDFAAMIGGEFAFAIDGPLLPVPSWKVIFEVNDPAGLQKSFEHLVDEVNRLATKDGKAGIKLDRVDVDGRAFYTLKSLDTQLEINYTFVNGYFVAAPSRALVDRALRYHESGVTLRHSARFLAALPEDGNANFSALIYHDLSALLSPLAQSGLTGSLSQANQDAIKSLSSSKPTVACAYAQGDRIIFAVNMDGPFSNLNNLMLGMPGPLGIQKLLQNAMELPKSNNGK